MTKKEILIFTILVGLIILYGGMYLQHGKEMSLYNEPEAPPSGFYFIAYQDGYEQGVWDAKHNNINPKWYKK